MLDFYTINVKEPTPFAKDQIYVVSPDFQYANVLDLICKGGSMYVFWDEDNWSDNLDQLICKVDAEIRTKVEELRSTNPGAKVVGRYFNDNRTKIMTDFVSYAKNRKQSNVPFNTKILFSDVVIKREDYATNQLPYTPTEGNTPAFDELLGLLYSDVELEKIVWFMGALFTNSMKNIEKFMFLYGGKGSGKGTVIKIFKMLFEGYHSAINLSTLTGGSEFATSDIREIPLLIDDDSDISKIKNDTYLLKLTAHEPLSVNAKYKQTYDVTFNGLLITASNQRFQVRNVDSGITRRAVVVVPTSRTHDPSTYAHLMSRVRYELPMIAQKAINLFNDKGPYYYEDYMPVEMAEATDHIFSFVRENCVGFGDPVSLQRIAELYKIYLEELGFDTKGYKRKIKLEMQRYFDDFSHEKRVDGQKLNNVFSGFKRDVAFPEELTQIPAVKEFDIGLYSDESFLDDIAADYPAQLANDQGTPKVAWDNCMTTLKDIDTSKLHYVRVPMNHIVIDFDMKDANGKKDLIRNVEASKKFPPTYTELSKSGKGVHLHYIYDGDVGQLASLYEDDVEIKVFTGKQSLRRMLTKCNDLAIAHITTGLPIKEKGGPTVYQDVEIIAWNEKKIRTAVKGNLEKKYHSSTKPSMDFIQHIFEKAEKEGVKYDLRDMRQDIMVFASMSSNNAQYCLKVANQIKYCTIDDVVDTPLIQAGGSIVADKDITFYDIEVFPNLFVVAFKQFGDPEVTVWINPGPAKIETLVKKNLVGFNNRRYDNHIIYAAMLGEDNMSLYRQSQRIINKSASNGMYGGAYELSYADIYDYNSKKQGLKKWEIELGIKHIENDLPWDQPVPMDMWPQIGEYCANDVLATEEVFKATYHDYTARKIISTLSGLSVNATTTQHAAAFLFGNDPRPQDKFNYTDLSKMFEGYKYSFGKSEYRGEDPGEGGYVYSEPGVYTDVALLDIASMHPNSLINLDYFGPYAKAFKELVQARIFIKHGELDKARLLFNGALVPFLENEEDADALSYALKIIINIIYGMTSAKFDNKFKHKDNDDNIVAKRGALFMINLKHEVQSRGFTVAHIKTDSIKIPNATQEIIDFVFEYGRQYGYTFEHEHTYERMALVNKAVYISQYFSDKKGKLVWEAVGSQFADPYVHKKLFTREPIEEDDYFITKQATAPIYLGDSFVGKIAQVYASNTGFEMFRVAEDKKGAIAGTKGYLWRLIGDYQGKEDIDMSYYDGLVTDALSAIEKVGDVNKIVDPFEVNDNYEENGEMSKEEPF